MKKACIVVLILVTVPWLASAQPSGADSSTAGIREFNRAFADATRSMDNAATMALWEEDGVSLLPSTKPIVGKKAIGRFIEDVTSRFPGARMEKFESQCFDIQVSGDWASEWCTEHQIVSIPNKPTFDGWGKMALVLHRDADGKWRLKQEMWNQAVAPDAAGR